MSLRWRIAVGLAVIAGIVCAFGATGAYLTTKRQLQNSVDESLVACTRDANDDRFPGGGRPRPGPGPGFGNQGCPQPGELQPASAAQLVAEDGTITQCILGGPTLPVTACRLPDAGDRRHRVPDAHVAMARGRRHPDRA